VRWPRYMQTKASGVEWLGDVPAHWELKPLKHTIVSLVNGVWGDEPDGGDEDISVVRVADFDRVQLRTQEQIPTSRRIPRRDQVSRLLTEGDLLIEKSGGGEQQSVGVVVRFMGAGPAVTSNFVARMQVADECDGAFLVYMHHALYVGRINQRSIKQTTGIQNLDAGSYLSELIAAPPPDEQRTIAAFLDRETARIDALVAAKRRLIALLQEKRAALIARAVTRGLDPDVPTKDSGVAWLGRVPAHWEVMPLKRAVDVRGGLTPDKSNADYWGGEVPWVTAKDMKRPRLSSSEDYTTALALSETSLRWIEPPAALIVVRGMILAHTFPVAEIDAAVTINQDMKALLPKPGVDSSYLAWLLRGASAFLLSCAEESAHGTKALRTEVLFNVPIPMPPPEEQGTIAAHIESTAGKLAATKLRVESAIARLTEYRSTLITSAVTGRIDVRAAA
jgi:type I restriction enzyme, S subunit